MATMEEIKLRSDLAFAEGELRALRPFVEYVKTYYPEVAWEAVGRQGEHVHDVGQGRGMGLTYNRHICKTCGEYVKISVVRLEFDGKKYN